MPRLPDSFTHRLASPAVRKCHACQARVVSAVCARLRDENRTIILSLAGRTRKCYTHGARGSPNKLESNWRRVDRKMFQKGWCCGILSTLCGVSFLGGARRGPVLKWAVSSASSAYCWWGIGGRRAAELEQSTKSLLHGRSKEGKAAIRRPPFRPPLPVPQRPAPVSSAWQRRQDVGFKEWCGL